MDTWLRTYVSAYTNRCLSILQLFVFLNEFKYDST